MVQMLSVLCGNQYSADCWKLRRKEGLYMDPKY